MAKSKKSSKRAMSLADMPMTGEVAGPHKPSKEDRARERRYAAQSAMETLMRAEEHKSNPRLMSDVKRLAAEHAAKMTKIAGK